MSDMPEQRTSLVVTPEFFEYLLAELERPPRVNPKMVALFRSARGVVKQQ